jgi:hypothetical protein
MLDIDRNINSIIYNKIDNIENSLSIDINLSAATLIKTTDVNIVNDITKQNVFFATLNKGIYYYRHTFNKVTSDNLQCLFMASTNKISPFFSYYGQSPIIDIPLTSLIGQTFLVDKDKTNFYVYIKPDSETFKISGYISIWKLPED